MWAQIYYRVNCFDVGNSIIVMECKLVHFSKRNNDSWAHLKIIRL